MKSLKFTRDKHSEHLKCKGRKSKARQCLLKTFPRHFIVASEDRVTKRGYGTDANAGFKTALGLKNTSQQYIEGM